jgi:hypothetical protein
MNTFVRMTCSGLLHCVFVMITVFLSPSLAQQPVYKTFLHEPVPANRTEVPFNAPVLRWPYQKGPNVKYEVRMSQTQNFPATSTIMAQGLTGAFFNPHRLLDKGQWYWQYRVAGKPWSSVLNFSMSDRATTLVSPSPADFLSKVPQGHPRILKDDSGQDMRNLAQRAEGAAILAEARVALKQKIFKESDGQSVASGSTEQQQKKISQDAIVRLGHGIHQMTLSLCQAYILTGETKYRAKALEMAMEIASWDPNGLTEGSDFTDGACMYDMALVFDTFYEELSPAQKNTLQAAITVRASRFYHHWVNSIESKVLSGHVWQLLLNEFFKTSLALYRHEAEAGEWLSYSYELFLARTPVLAGPDGGWAEGASYFQMNMEMLLDIPQKIMAYTNFDFINRHPWYRNQADWLIYQVPPGGSADGFGDNTEEILVPPASYAAYALVMASRLQEPRFSWYASKMVQLQKIKVAEEPTHRWFRLLYTDGKIPPLRTDTLRFPMARAFIQSGVASLHTDPAHPEKDIMVSMRASPFGAYGHILGDQNTFNIMVGGKRLFFRTGYKVAMNDPHRLGWSRHTRGNNGVLIDGEGQPYSIEAFGHFSRFLQGSDLAYLKGDASMAYRSKETKEDYGLSKFYRHLVLLKPGIVIIYDELEAERPVEWSWLIHSLEHMSLDSTRHRFVSTIERASGAGSLWSSSPVRWSLSNKFDIPAVNFRALPGRKGKEYNDTQWHLRASNTKPSSRMRFFSVIRIGESGVDALPVTEVPGSPGMMRVSVGDWHIEAALSEVLAPQLNIRSVSGGSAFSAYGRDMEFQGRLYQPHAQENSRLMEFSEGKVKITESADIPIPLP